MESKLIIINTVIKEAATTQACRDQTKSDGTAQTSTQMHKDAEIGTRPLHPIPIVLPAPLRQLMAHICVFRHMFAACHMESCQTRKRRHLNLK